VIFAGNNTLSCIDFAGTNLFGDFEFQDGSMLDVKLDFCKQDQASEGVQCKGLDEIYQWF
jgi:hypothetical protein